MIRKYQENRKIRYFVANKRTNIIYLEIAIFVSCKSAQKKTILKY